MKITFTKNEWKHLDTISAYTDLLPSEDKVKKGDKYIVDLSHQDWDEISDFVAGEANHAESSYMESKFDDLYDKIEEHMLANN